MTLRDVIRGIPHAGGAARGRHATSAGPAAAPSAAPSAAPAANAAAVEPRHPAEPGAPTAEPEQRPDSAEYWEARYSSGGTSGAGSRNRLAEFKARVLNDFVAANAVASVIEFGSGDGDQVSMFRFPDYTGVDVSRTAVRTTRRLFAGNPAVRFLHTSEVTPADRADLALSLDVVYHLVEDDVFEAYMQRLFDATTRFAIVYSSDAELPSPAPHVRHRPFSRWVAAHRPDFALVERIPNAHPYDPAHPDDTSFADFFVFERRGPTAG